MADTTKKTVDNATKGKRVTVRLPRLHGQNAIQEDFYSINGKRFIIKRGETVEIPENLGKLIQDNEKAEESALNYVDDLTQKQKEKEKELGL